MHFFFLFSYLHRIYDDGLSLVSCHAVLILKSHTKKVKIVFTTALDGFTVKEFTVNVRKYFFWLSTHSINYFQ